MQCNQIRFWAMRSTSATAVIASIIGLTLISCNRSPVPVPPHPSRAHSLKFRLEVPTGIVINTGDGDTLRVLLNWQMTTIRLSCIDAPESRQEGGSASASRLRELLPIGQVVGVRKVDTDNYGRTVAEVYVKGQSVNLILVKEGMAMVYPQYVDGCAATQNQYLRAEQEAQSQRLGFWGQENPTMPWDWRRNGDNAPATGTGQSLTSGPGSTGETGQLPACVNSDCDCGDFSTQEQAQRVFDSYAGDPFKLDGDGDRRVCEVLP